VGFELYSRLVSLLDGYDSGCIEDAIECDEFDGFFDMVEDEFLDGVIGFLEG